MAKDARSSAFRLTYRLALAAMLAFASAADANVVRTRIVGEPAPRDALQFAPGPEAPLEERIDGSDVRKLDELPYTPGRLIVKLDAEQGARALASGAAVRAAFGIAELDRLNRRYGAVSLARPFADRNARIAARSGRTDHRTARAPAGAVAPSFDDVYVVELSRYLDMEAVAREYARVPGVVYAEPDRKATTWMTTNDPYLGSSGAWTQPFADLWGIHKIDAPAAWDTTRGAGIVVAVIDTGIDAAHAEMAGRMWTNAGEVPGNGIDDDDNGYIDDDRGWDFTSLDNDPFDDFGHGTHCAGTIAAAGNNATGVVGVAWECSLMAVKGLDANGGGTVISLAEAILYATDNGADVINASWGGSGEADLITDAVTAATAAGVVFVAAAGNSASDARGFFPAGVPESIAVSAFDSNDQVAFFSNFGPAIDVGAPGGGDEEPDNKVDPFRSVLSLRSSGAGSDMTGDGKLIVDDDYIRQAGTSMAAPHVAGTVALILAAHPEFTVTQVRGVLRTSADDIDLPGNDVNSGYGRVNAADAVAVDSALDVVITSPSWNDVVSINAVDILGTVDGSDFQSYALEYGAGDFPTSWTPILAAGLSPVSAGLLATWDTSGVEDGVYTIRVLGTTTLGDTFEDRTTITIDRLTISAPASYTIHRAGGALEIRGTAYAPGFTSYTVEYRTVGADLVEGPWLSDAMAPAAGGATPVFDGLLATLDTASFTAGRDVDLRLTINGTVGSTSQTFYHVVLDPDLRPGFPVSVPGLPDRYIRMQGHMTIADLDGDGTKEILAAYGDLIFVIEPDGTDRPGWPQSVADDDPDYTILANAAPAAADLDNDGDLEVVTGNGKSMFIWHDDGTPMAGWPQVLTLGDGFYTSGAPRDYTIADVDGDGLRDILMTRRTWVVAMRSDGSMLPGWPAKINDNIYLSPPPWERTISVGDVTGDGSPEVVVVETRGFHNPQILHVYDGGGVELPGFPQPITKRNSIEENAPVLADLDGNGVLDIAANSDRTKGLSTLDGAGNRLRMRTRIPNFKQRFPGAGTFGSEQELLTAGDIDGDGDAEILVSTETQNVRVRCGGYNCTWTFVFARTGTNYVQVVDSEAREVSGWPVAYAYTSGDNAHGPGSVAIGDIDGDGSQDLVLGTGMCSAPYDYSYHRCFGIDAFRRSGSRLAGFPKPLPHPGATQSVMPAIGDLDGDGLKDIVFVDYGGHILAWSVPGTPGPENMQWPMYRHDPAHTGSLQ